MATLVYSDVPPIHYIQVSPHSTTFKCPLGTHLIGVEWGTPEWSGVGAHLIGVEWGHTWLEWSGDTREYSGVGGHLNVVEWGDTWM